MLDTCCCLGVVCGGLGHNLKPNPLVWLFFISHCAFRRASFWLSSAVVSAYGTFVLRGRGSADLEGSADPPTGLQGVAGWLLSRTLDALMHLQAMCVDCLVKLERILHSCYTLECMSESMPLRGRRHAQDGQAESGYFSSCEQCISIFNRNVTESNSSFPSSWQMCVCCNPQTSEQSPLG